MADLQNLLSVSDDPPTLKFIADLFAAEERFYREKIEHKETKRTFLPTLVPGVNFILRSARVRDLSPRLVTLVYLAVCYYFHLVSAIEPRILRQEKTKKHKDASSSLSDKERKAEGRQTIQYALCCLRVACKVFDVFLPDQDLLVALKVDTFHEDKLFNKKNLDLMDLSVRAVLKEKNVKSITPFDFLRYYMSLFLPTSEVVLDRIMVRSQEIISQCQFGFKIWLLRP